MAMLEVKHLKKIYATRFGGNKVEALRDVNFTVEQGEYTAWQIELVAAGQGREPGL